jgi:hypothetical protein
MTVVINSRAADAEVPVPAKSDGTWYRYEMVCYTERTRVYADTPHELIAYLIPGYDTLTGSHDQGVARTRYAVDVQVHTQANINATVAQFAASAAERDILFGGRAQQPTIETWASTVPLVLIDTFYQPHTDQPAPVSDIADVADPENIWWLTPAAGEFAFLESLAHTGFIGFHVAKDVTP